MDLQETEAPTGEMRMSEGLSGLLRTDSLRVLEKCRELGLVYPWPWGKGVRTAEPPAHVPG